MMKFHVNFSLFTQRYEFYIKDAGKIISSVKFTEDPDQDAAIYRQPSMVLEDYDAQSLLQALWDAGLRPNNGESTVAHVDALKKHLEDMRKFADRGFTALEKLTEKEKLVERIRSFQANRSNQF